MAATLVCPLCGTVVADGVEPAPGDVPRVRRGLRRRRGDAARRGGPGARGVGRRGALGRRPRAAPVRGRAARPRPAPAAAITSDRRDGFYLWWVFVRAPGADAARSLAAFLG